MSAICSEHVAFPEMLINLQSKVKFMKMMNIIQQMSASELLTGKLNRVLCYEYLQVIDELDSVWTIPDFLFNLCLGIQIKRISRQKSDPLLLSLGSILLLLQQHFGETF